MLLKRNTTQGRSVMKINNKMRITGMGTPNSHSKMPRPMTILLIRYPLQRNY
jgi:hypothetical protein